MFFCDFSFMASKHERTAYIYLVPIGTLESTLRSALNNSNQAEYSVDVKELKQGVATVKICGNGLYCTLWPINNQPLRLFVVSLSNLHQS